MSRAAKELYQRHRHTVDEYHRMGEADVFDTGVRLELIDGEIIEMAPIGSMHAGTVTRLTRLLERAVGDMAIVYVQNPVVLDDRSEPQPDLALLKPRDDFYTERHPVPEDVLLIIEVSDSTLHYDQEVKVPMYARIGIPEVWIVDLTNKQLHYYRQPSEHGFGHVSQPGSLEAVEIVRLPQISLDLTTLLPTS